MRSAQNPLTHDLPSHISLCTQETVHKQAFWRGCPMGQQWHVNPAGQVVSSRLQPGPSPPLAAPPLDIEPAVLAPAPPLEDAPPELFPDALPPCDSPPGLIVPVPACITAPPVPLLLACTAGSSACSDPPQQYVDGAARIVNQRRSLRNIEWPPFGWPLFETKGD